MSVSRLLRHWKTEPSIAGCVEAWQNIPAREPRFRPLPPELHPGLAGALKSRGIRSLYTHQAAAWEHLAAERNVVVVSGTASGKTLCYNLPVLDWLLRDPQARALYLFPTKALAQDQLKNLLELSGGAQASGGTVETIPPIAPAI